jgi:hypothetical protein
MTLYAGWVADQERYAVAAICGAALGDSPDDPAFCQAVDLESSFFPPSVSCVLGSQQAELIDERARTTWTAVELAGFTLTSTGSILVVVGVFREWRTARPVDV